MVKEKILEEITMDLLYELGYELQTSDKIEEPESRIILEKDITKALEKINPTISKKQIAKIIKKIKDLKEKNDILNNKKFTRYLQEGILLEGKKIEIIDFKNKENNIFKAVSEYCINDKSTVKIDVVIFINGLPLVVVELKGKEEALNMAYKQLKNYQESKVPKLFHYNQLMVVADSKKAKIGTITSSWEQFQEWKKIKSEEEIQENTYIALMKGVFCKDRILDIINHFIMWKDEEKILVNYYQYFAVKKAIQETDKAMKNKKKKIGILQHAPGAGKTMLQMFYLKSILRDYKVGNILILTDRKEIEEQLFRTYVKCFEIPIEKIEKSQDIQDLRNIEKQWIIFSTIQKLLIQNSLISIRDDILIIVDEIKSFNGERLTRKLEELLPNAMYLGITTIPEKEIKTNQTKSIFGDIIDKYDMPQAILDGSILPIAYEQRKIEENIINCIQEEISTKELLGSEKRKDSLVKDIIQHYEKIENTVANKAMVVTRCVKDATEIYKKFIQLRPDWKNKVQLVVSSRKEVMENGRNLEAEFKNMEAEFKIAIVVDMWITGIDVPRIRSYVY